MGRVLEAAPHPNADKLLVLKVDLGTEQRQIIAGIKPYCAPEALVGKDIIVVANLAPRKMRGLDSNGMLLAATNRVRKLEPAASAPRASATVRPRNAAAITAAVSCRLACTAVT